MARTRKGKVKQVQARFPGPEDLNWPSRSATTNAAVVSPTTVPNMPAVPHTTAATSTATPTAPITTVPTMTAPTMTAPTIAVPLATVPPANGNCPFMALPDELREAIYKPLFAKVYEIMEDNSFDELVRHNSALLKTCISPGVMRTNRMMRSEAMSLYLDHLRELFKIFRKLEFLWQMSISMNPTSPQAIAEQHRRTQLRKGGIVVAELLVKLA